jgi:hypothetical protein
MNFIGTIKLATDLAVAQTATAYSDSFRSDVANGFMAALIVTTDGSLTVTQQASCDGTTFYDVVDSDNNAQGAVAATLLVGSRYVQFSCVLAPYVRFKVREGDAAPTVVNITLINQDQA